MAQAKIAITLDEGYLSEIDRLVRQGVFPNRSKAIEAAVKDRVEKEHRSRLARECSKLDKQEEQRLAEEHLSGESDWPEY